MSDPGCQHAGNSEGQKDKREQKRGTDNRGRRGVYA
jgi:hypothetical protein